MSKCIISDEDYLHHLREQYDFLISDIGKYEHGESHFGKKIAATLRTIFHDTPESKAILPALAQRLGQSMTFKYSPNAYAIARDNSCVLYTGFQIGRRIMGSDYYDNSRYKDTDFDTYWNCPVFKDGSIVYTRKQIILFGANKFGGAHVDPEIPEKFLKLVGNSGWKLRSGNHDEETLVTRVAYEMGIHVTSILKRLIPKLEKHIGKPDAQYEILKDLPYSSGLSSRLMEVLERGSDFGIKGDHKSALDTFEIAIKADSLNSDAWFGKGTALAYLQRFEEAIDALDRAIEYAPQNGLAWHNKSLCLEKLDRNNEALVAVNTAIALKPDCCSAWYCRGLVLGKLDKFEDALQSFNHVSTSRPDYKNTLYFIGLSLRYLNRHEEALTALDKAILLRPDNEKAWYDRACVHALLQDSSEALSDLKKAIDLESSNKIKAAKDNDFISIRSTSEFIALIS